MKQPAGRLSRHSATDKKKFKHFNGIIKLNLLPLGTEILLKLKQPAGCHSATGKKRINILMD